MARATIARTASGSMPAKEGSAEAPVMRARPAAARENFIVAGAVRRRTRREEVVVRDEESLLRRAQRRDACVPTATELLHRAPYIPVEPRTVHPVMERPQQPRAGRASGAGMPVATPHSPPPDSAESCTSGLRLPFARPWFARWLDRMDLHAAGRRAAGAGLRPRPALDLAAAMAQETEFGRGAPCSAALRTRVGARGPRWRTLHGAGASRLRRCGAAGRGLHGKSGEARATWTVESQHGCRRPESDDGHARRA